MGKKEACPLPAITCGQALLKDKIFEEDQKTGH